MLAGAAGLTRLQPGACCGCTSGVACTPCAIPAADLTCSWATITAPSCTTSGSFTLAYDPTCSGGGFACWTATMPTSPPYPCFMANCATVLPVRVTLDCFPRVIEMGFSASDGGVDTCAQVGPTSYTCSPFQVVFALNCTSGCCKSVTFTVTG